MYQILESRGVCGSSLTTVQPGGRHSIRESYDRLADEHPRRMFKELRHKPLDRLLLDRFAQTSQDVAEYVTWVTVLVMHVARYRRHDSFRSGSSP